MNKILIFTFLISFSIFGSPALNIADSLLKAKDYKSAEKKYSEVVLDDTTNKFALYGKAYSLMKMKEYMKSAETFKILIGIDENFKDTLYRYAFVNRKMKKYSTAVKFYKKYIQLNPTATSLPDAYYGLAQTYKYMGDKVNSAFYYEKYSIVEKRASEQKWVKKAKKKSQDFIAEFNAEEKNRYSLLLNKNNLVKTKKEETKNITVKKENPVEEKKKVENDDFKVKNNVIIIKKEKRDDGFKVNNNVIIVNKNKKAEIVVKPNENEKVITIKKEKKESEMIIPKNIDNNSSENKNLNYMFKKSIDGDKLYLDGKYLEAIEAYRGYLSMPSKRREGLFKTAVCYALLKKYKKSVDMFSQIIVEEQDDKKVKNLLKLLLSNQIVVESMLTQKTKIKNGIGIKGVQAFVMKGNYNQALEMLDILINKIDQNSKALLYKLDLLRIVGRNDEIDKTITDFLTRYPDDSLVNERYGDILKADGKKDKAERYYQKAFANAKNKSVSKRLEMKMAN